MSPLVQVVFVSTAAIVCSGALLYLFRDVLAARLTRTLVLSGQYGRALRRLRWLSVGMPSARISSMEGAIRSVCGPEAEAELCFRRVLALGGKAGKPVRRDALCSLGLLLAEMGRDDEAQRCLEESVALGDRSVTVQFATASLLIAQGREPERALAMIEEVMGSAGPLRRLACLADKALVLAQLGRFSKWTSPSALSWEKSIHPTAWFPPEFTARSVKR